MGWIFSLEGFDVALLVKISRVGFVYNNRIHLRKSSPNPSLGGQEKGNANLFHRRLGKHLLKAVQSPYVSHEVYSRPPNIMIPLVAVWSQPWEIPPPPFFFFLTMLPLWQQF